MTDWRRWYGKRVRVVSGNKIPIGTEGTVFWFGAGRSYGYSKMLPMRVGFKSDAGETLWTNRANVEEVGPAITEVEGMARNWEMEAV